MTPAKLQANYSRSTKLIYVYMYVTYTHIKIYTYTRTYTYISHNDKQQKIINFKIKKYIYTHIYRAHKLTHHIYTDKTAILYSHDNRTTSIYINRRLVKGNKKFNIRQNITNYSHRYKKLTSYIQYQHICQKTT